MEITKSKLLTSCWTQTIRGELPFLVLSREWEILKENEQAGRTVYYSDTFRGKSGNSYTFTFNTPPTPQVRSLYCILLEQMQKTNDATVIITKEQLKDATALNCSNTTEFFRELDNWLSQLGDINCLIEDKSGGCIKCPISAQTLPSDEERSFIGVAQNNSNIIVFKHNEEFLLYTENSKKRINRPHKVIRKNAEDISPSTPRKNPTYAIFNEILQGQLGVNRDKTLIGNYVNVFTKIFKKLGENTTQRHLRKYIIEPIAENFRTAKKDGIIEDYYFIKLPPKAKVTSVINKYFSLENIKATYPDLLLKKERITTQELQNNRYVVYYTKPKDYPSSKKSKKKETK